MSRRIQDVWAKKILEPGETDFAAELRTFLFFCFPLKVERHFLACRKVEPAKQSFQEVGLAWPRKTIRLWYGSELNGFGF